MYQTVIFDLDGTLLDTIADLAAAGNFVCRERGWPEYSNQAFAAMVGHGMLNLVTRFSPPEAQDPETLRETLRRFEAYYALHTCDKTRPYPGMPDLTGRLHREGVTLAVYSNKGDEFTQTLIARFFPGCFDLVQGKVEGIPVKPDPAGIHRILGKLRADPRRTLFVGDSSVDIRTGQNAGTHTCGVSWGYRPRSSLTEAGAETVADTATELEECIRRG